MTGRPLSQRERRGHPERGASAVEYGLLVGGIVATFLVGAIGLQAAVGAVFEQNVNSVVDTDSSVSQP